MILGPFRTHTAHPVAAAPVPSVRRKAEPAGSCRGNGSLSRRAKRGGRGAAGADLAVRAVGRSVRVAATLLACLLVVAGSVAAGDPEMAKFLLKGAKTDIGKKQFEPAFTKLQRAELEDPSLLEAAYWTGFVLERRDDPKAAVAAYRRFLAGVAARAKAGSPYKEEGSLAKKAQERLDALAAGEVERRKLDDAFVDGLLAFARATLGKDPLTCAEAVKLALEVRPDHVEARKLLARLGATPPAASAVPPAPGAAGGGPKPAPPKGPDPGAAPGDLRGVKSWKDLMVEPGYVLDVGWESLPNGTLKVEHHGGMLRNPRVSFDMPADYALEMECRVTQPFEDRHSLGFGFAFEKTDVRRFYVLFLVGDSVVLAWADGEEAGDVFRAVVPPAGADGWHRIGVAVRGLRMEVFVDGKRIGEHQDSRRKSLVGEPTLFVQDCQGEIRSFRRGALP